jgi:hypothetical protein
MLLVLVGGRVRGVRGVKSFEKKRDSILRHRHLSLWKKNSLEKAARARKVTSDEVHQNENA